ncbi:hypothetical protein ScPMuIL_009801 [Solemya velum]
MSASMLKQGLNISTRCLRSNYLLRQHLSSTTNGEGATKDKSDEINVTPTADQPKRVGGFAKAFEKFEKIQSGELDSDLNDNESFASLLRKSKLVQMGDCNRKTIVGTVIDVVEDDLYIDFGGKFHCVCSRPDFQKEKFHEGVRVKLQLNDMEMTSSFLGSEKHITLLEADATLLGIHRSETWKVS